MANDYVNNLLRDLGWEDMEDIPTDFFQTCYVLAKLSGGCGAEALAYRYKLGYSFENTAKMCRVSAPTVKKIINKTLETIRTQYADVARMGMAKFCGLIPLEYRSGEYRDGYLDACNEIREVFQFRKNAAEFKTSKALESNTAAPVPDIIEQYGTAKALEVMDNFIKRSEEGIISKSKAKEAVTV